MIVAFGVLSSFSPQMSHQFQMARCGKLIDYREPGKNETALLFEVSKVTHECRPVAGNITEVAGGCCGDGRDKAGRQSGTRRINDDEVGIGQSHFAAEIGPDEPCRTAEIGGKVVFSVLRQLESGHRRAAPRRKKGKKTDSAEKVEHPYRTEFIEKSLDQGDQCRRPLFGCLKKTAPRDPEAFPSHRFFYRFIARRPIAVSRLVFVLHRTVGTVDGITPDDLVKAGMEKRAILERHSFMRGTTGKGGPSADDMDFGPRPQAELTDTHEARRNGKFPSVLMEKFCDDTPFRRLLRRVGHVKKTAAAAQAEKWTDRRTSLGTRYHDAKVGRPKSAPDALGGNDLNRFSGQGRRNEIGLAVAPTDTVTG